MRIAIWIDGCVHDITYRNKAARLQNEIQALSSSHDLPCRKLLFNLRQPEFEACAHSVVQTAWEGVCDPSGGIVKLLPDVAYFARHALATTTSISLDHQLTKSCNIVLMRALTCFRCAVIDEIQILRIKRNRSCINAHQLEH